MRQTKIVCTIGPAIDSEEMLIQMFNAGMNVARLNFSHGTPATAVKQIARIRNASAKVNKYIGIMLDTKGPEIRTGVFDGGSCSYKKGDIVNLYKKEIRGTHEGFHVNCEELFSDVAVGNLLLVDDGKISLQVKKVSDDIITCEFLTDGIIKDHKGINVPGIDLTMPFISEQDYNDIKFGCEQGVDIIALSFVRTAEDILAVRKLLTEFNSPNIEIVAKIESKQGIDNLEAILQNADGIMVARGDLGVEVAPELVPLYQKRMIKLANQYGKPVITATHMLESMIINPRPTRAEASDVANAILDGSDAVMLSGESAIGKFPVESVNYMNRIAIIAEEMMEKRNYDSRELANSSKFQSDAISLSAAEISYSLKNIKAIFAFTETGGTARRICKFRPRVPIIACTDSPETCRRLSYYRGVFPTIASYVNDIGMCDEIANVVADSIGYKQGDTIIITAGFGVKHGVTNTMRIIELS